MTRPEFLAQGVEQNGSAMLVYGVVSEAEVHVRHVFRRIVFKSGKEVECELTVENIISYRNELSLLCRGSSGDLFVSGDMVELQKILEKGEWVSLR